MMTMSVPAARPVIDRHGRRADRPGPPDGTPMDLGARGKTAQTMSWSISPGQLGSCRPGSTDRRRATRYGTVGRKRLLLQLRLLRRTVPDEGPPRAGEQLAEGAHRIKLLRQPGAAGLLTARRRAP